MQRQEVQGILQKGSRSYVAGTPGEEGLRVSIGNRRHRGFTNQLEFANHGSRVECLCRKGRPPMTDGDSKKEEPLLTRGHRFPHPS